MFDKHVESRYVPRALWLLMFLALWPLQSWTQAGVPSSEPTQLTGSVVISVVDSAGAAVPHAAVKIANVNTGVIRSTFTDETGELRVAQLPPGNYQVVVSLSGFAEARQDFGVSVGAAQRITVRLAMGGPVPGGEPSSGAVPDSAATGVVVLEKQFSDDLSLQDWLNQQVANNVSLVAIVPQQDKKTLFVMAKAGVRAPANFVVSVDKAVQADDLQRRIRSHPDQTFVGIHRLSSNTYLMVFRAGS